MGKSSKGFCVFYDWMETLDDLDPADAYKVIRAISKYYETGEDPVKEFTGALKGMVKLMFQQIKRAEQTAEARSAAGKASAEARFVEVCSNNVEQKATSVEQRSTTETETETYTETIKETLSNERVKKTAPRFSAPSVDEVREYALSADLRIDAEQFVDHYQAVGWKIGNKPMKDWKAACRNWSRRETEFKREKKPPDKVKASFDTEDFWDASLKRAYGDDQLVRDLKAKMGVTA